MLHFTDHSDTALNTPHTLDRLNPNQHETMVQVKNAMPKPKQIVFAVVVAVATLAPPASASAGIVLSNHNEALLLDA